MNVPAKAPVAALGLLAALAAALLLLAAARPAAGAFGTESAGNVDIHHRNKDGSPATQAGSHPYPVTTSSTSTASTSDFRETRRRRSQGRCSSNPRAWSATPRRCPTAIVDLRPASAWHRMRMPHTAASAQRRHLRLDELVRPNRDTGSTCCPQPTARWPGLASAFSLGGLPIHRLPRQRRCAYDTGRLPQVSKCRGSLRAPGRTDPVGGPASPGHDAERGGPGFSLPRRLPEFDSHRNRMKRPKPFITLPTRCEPAATAGKPTPGRNRASSRRSVSPTTAEPPEPQGFTGCGKLPFAPNGAKPTSNAGAARPAST